MCVNPTTFHFHPTLGLISWCRNWVMVSYELVLSYIIVLNPILKRTGLKCSVFSVPCVLPLSIARYNGILYLQHQHQHKHQQPTSSSSSALSLPATGRVGDLSAQYWEPFCCNDDRINQDDHRPDTFHRTSQEGPPMMFSKSCSFTWWSPQIVIMQHCIVSMQDCIVSMQALVFKTSSTLPITVFPYNSNNRFCSNGVSNNNNNNYNKNNT